MTLGRIEMKVVDQEAEFRNARDAVLADQGYFPPLGDQSWREQVALRIAADNEKNIANMTANMDPIPQEDVLESEPASPGLIGIVFAIFTFSAIAFAIVALTFPDILTAGSWRAHRGAVNSAAGSTAAPAIAVNAPAFVPAPLAERLPPPQSQRPLVASPGLNGASATNATPDTITMPEVAPKPRPQPTPREEADNRGTGGFYAMVAKPDGTLENRYFPSEPSPQVQPALAAVPGLNTARAANAIPEAMPKPRHRSAMRSAERDEVDGRGTRGFYTMVIGMNGTLEYKHFPSKWSH